MFYGYLFATLPTLKCGVTAEITLADFDKIAGDVLSRRRFEQLVSWDEPEVQVKGVYREMREFDRFLKLRIAENRQEKLGLFTGLPQPDDFYSEVDFALPAAAASDDPLERERMVDLIRWGKIDDLETGHEMDFVSLCCYRLRLASLEKYHRRNAVDGTAVFEETVNRLSGVINEM